MVRSLFWLLFAAVVVGAGLAENRRHERLLAVEAEWYADRAEAEAQRRLAIATAELRRVTAEAARRRAAGPVTASPPGSPALPRP